MLFLDRYVHIYVAFEKNEIVKTYFHLLNIEKFKSTTDLDSKFFNLKGLHISL